jgi:hypothetical protein
LKVTDLRKIVDEVAAEEMRRITRATFADILAGGNPADTFGRWRTGISRCEGVREKLNKEIDRMGEA